MSNNRKGVEISIKFYGEDLVVTGNYLDEVPLVMYYSDMSGHPGDAEEFEILSVLDENDVEIKCTVDLEELEKQILKENYS